MKIILTVALQFLAMSFPLISQGMSCKNVIADAAAERLKNTGAPGDLISITPMKSKYEEYLKDAISGKDVLAFEVKLFKLVYHTTDPLGKPTIASGLLQIPSNPGQPSRALPLLSYQHGGIWAKSKSPSNENGSEQGALWVFNPKGYVFVMADYLGLGDSTIQQPMYHAKSLATATADMLRAARKACAKLNVQLNSKLFLTGYSQGGHATMALHRYLESELKSEFTVTASAPISGGYDIENLNFLNLLTKPKFMSPYKVAYIIYSMNSIYKFLSSLEEAFLPEWAQKIPKILDSSNSQLANQPFGLSSLFPETIDELLQLKF